MTDFRYLTQSKEQRDAGWSRTIAQDLLQAAAELFAGGAADGAGTDDGTGAAARAAAGDGALRIGFEDAHVSVRTHARLASLLPDGAEAIAAGDVVEQLRVCKDAGELDRIRAAAALADDALSEVLERGLVGRTEREVALDIEMTMRRRGAEAASFAPIVAAGPHGALPHAEPRDVEIPAGTLCVIDWGAQLDGYASDCTRTYATGALDPRDREVYELVLAAQLAAVDAVRPGPTGRDVDAVARTIIDDAGHAEHFGHGLGHGVGMEVHEGPRLSRQGDERLAPGMVVTIEPGVYVPGAIGVRIEDLVIVTEDGGEIVSTLDKTLQTIA